MVKPQLRCSGSVKNFKPKIKKIWGLEEWNENELTKCSVLFFGIYQMGDFEFLRKHEGDKIIFWCGSDLMNLVKVPELQGIIREFPDAIHYVENGLEHEELRRLGIKAEIRPSFLEDIDDFPVSFKPQKDFHIFISCHEGREEEYGINFVNRIAFKLEGVIFHVFGINGDSNNKVKFHGKVSPEQFNKEIQNYHCGLRPNEHDGFSEITAKSVLMGQYPITRIKYPQIDHYETEEQLIEIINKLKKIKEPNLEARDFWRKEVNNYPWMK